MAKDVVLNAVMPMACPCCGRDNASLDVGLCPNCFKRINFIRDPICHICGNPFAFEIMPQMLCLHCIRERPHFQQARSVFIYDDGSKPMILRFKHADATENAGFLAGLIKSRFQNILDDADAVVAVPLHFLRLLKRRYNQAALIAQKLADGKLEYLPDALKRTKHTRDQGKFGAKGRLENVKGVFAASGVGGRRIVLVDDVYTTGATAGECAKTLVEAGADYVDVITLARVAVDDSFKLS